MDEVNRAVRTGSPLAVALVDIDHFKGVNATYGHLVGDKALRAVADALRNQLRPYDLAGRFGGEEFAILLPHAREADALNVAEHLRRHIAAMSIPVGDDAESGPCFTLTISVGVAALDGASCELTDMLGAADAALYHAKETGRNKTHVITAPPRAPTKIHDHSLASACTACRSDSAEGSRHLPPKVTAELCPRIRVIRDNGPLPLITPRRGEPSYFLGTPLRTSN